MGNNALKTYMVMRNMEPSKRDKDYRIDDKAQDRRGREHYEDGRYAPMRNGYYEPVRMGGDDSHHEARRSWEIIENRNHEGGMGYDDDGMRRVMGFAGSSVDHPHINEMEHRAGEKMPGHASTRSMPMLTREMANDWMASLQNADGSRGAHWTFEEVKNLMQSRGVQGDPLIIWVGMNAEYSDSVMLNRKYGVDRPEYYLDAALTRWLNDKDAVKDKAAMYYTYVVKH